MFKLNKNILIITGLALLLVAAGIVNFKIGDGGNEKKQTQLKVAPTASAAVEQSETKAVSAQVLVANYVKEREGNRTEEISYLDGIINNAATDKDTLKTAQQQKIGIVSEMEKETKIEGLLSGKGFTDSFVTVGKDSVNVVVGKVQLTDAEVAQILSIVTSETGVGAEGVKIIPITG